MKKRIKNVICLVMVLAITIAVTGCGLLDSKIEDIQGSIKGCTYDCMFYSNDGQLFMTATGEKINLSSNIVKERTYSSEDGWGYVETLSSVVTITIDGNQMENCGSTAIFSQDDLKPDAEFNNIENIESTSDDSISNWTSVAGIVNEYKNYFGKAQVVVIQSQLGNPICAYSGNNVYWEVCEDLPKTTKLMIDGKALYIHRANFQIIDKELIN